jgi:hypothetical protein
MLLLLFLSSNSKVKNLISNGFFKGGGKEKGDSSLRSE